MWIVLLEKNPYHKLARGFGILPSRAMKNINNDDSDWGRD
jgi:hypothetical protein